MEKSKHKKRVAVLRGGPSEEYDISLITGASVINTLKDHPNFYPLDVVVTKNGEWLMDGRVYKPSHILNTIDIAFLSFHGAYGEDGTVQRLLERHSVPYTGSGPYASALAMNKLITKDRLHQLGIKLAPHLRVTRQSLQSLHRLTDTIGQLFGPEYVVKPLCSGSSVGIIMADSLFNLIEALETALTTYPEVLVEKRIRGREATGGVVERFRGQDILALPIIEIVPPDTADYFDRTNKYDGSTKEICPGRFSAEEKTKMEEIARLVHRTLDLRQYSRSDFIVAGDDIYFLEVNTLPGLTPASLLPLSINTIGSSYQEFVIHLLNDASLN